MVVGVSRSGADALDACASNLGLPYSLVPDTNGDIVRAYDVRRRLGLGTSRTTFLIDAEGVVQLAHHSELSPASHARAVLHALGAG